MIGVILDFPGATLEQHDAAIAGMGFTPGGEGQADCLFHWVAKTGDGIRVVDVWTSREAFDRTLNGEFARQAEVLEFPQPEISFYDIHTTLKSRDL
jgi:hypothetical protein